MSDLRDQTSVVRDGETLPAAALEEYVRNAVQGITGNLVIEQFRSGHSNLTYLLKFENRELVLRRPPFGSKVKSAHDMGREFRVLSGLSGHYDKAPQVLAYCDSDEIIGAPFYLMERSEGVVFRVKKPAGLTVAPELVQGCCRAMVSNLVDLHALDWRAAGLEALYKGEGYMRRQVEGWAKRYEGSQTEEIETIDKTIAWLKAGIPEDADAVLIHNDYKYDNVMWAEDDLSRLVAVFDWEMATVGCPLADLGTMLAYWGNRGEDMMSTVGCFMTQEEGTLTRQALAALYGELSGRDVSNMVYYYVLGLFKLSVILQQIYYRYDQGLTKDERFAPMIYMVKMLGARTSKVIDTGKY